MFVAFVSVGFEIAQSQNTIHTLNHKEQGKSFHSSYYNIFYNYYRYLPKLSILAVITYYYLYSNDRLQEIHLRVHLKINTGEDREKMSELITTQNEKQVTSGVGN